MSETREKYNEADACNRPEITGLSVSQISITQRVITGTLNGSINTNDLSVLGSQQWKQALSEWLFNLCNGDIDIAIEFIKEAELKSMQDTLDEHDSFSHLAKEMERVNERSL